MYRDVEMNPHVGKTIHTSTILPCCLYLWQGAGCMCMYCTAGPAYRQMCILWMHAPHPCHTKRCWHMQRLQLPRCLAAPDSPSSCGADSQGFVCSPRVFLCRSRFPHPAHPPRAGALGPGTKSAAGLEQGHKGQVRARLLPGHPCGLVSPFTVLLCLAPAITWNTTRWANNTNCWIYGQV